METAMNYLPVEVTVLALNSDSLGGSSRVFAPVDLHRSKPLISLVLFNLHLHCFQGQGYCYVTIPIVFPAYQKQSFKQVRGRPFPSAIKRLDERLCDEPKERLQRFMLDCNRFFQRALEKLQMFLKRLGLILTQAASDTWFVVVSSPCFIYPVGVNRDMQMYRSIMIC